MNRNSIFITFFLLLFASFSFASNKIKDLQIIKQHYKNILINGGESSTEVINVLKQQVPEDIVSDQVTVDVQQRYPIDIAKCKKLISELNGDGSWSDINYKDDSHSGWDIKRHADRALMLARLYASSSTDKSLRKEAGAALHKVINYWFAKKFICGNWWYNEVGMPKTLGETFILFEDDMSKKEINDALSIVMSQAMKERTYTGQNLVWVKGNVLISALLSNDYDLAKECRDIISNEIVNTRKEGIKEDWSFHQHGPLQQFGNYGLSFLMSMSLYANILNGTSLSFEDSKISILSDFINDGYRWTMWKGFFDINSLTRQLYKCSQRDKAMGVMLSAALMRNAGDKEEKVYRNIFHENYSSNMSNDLIGNKYFWSSDCAFQRTKSWMASLRCCSSRVKPTENTNQENNLGYNMGQGSMFIYINGDDYYNDMPFWNWNFIPSTTSFVSEKSMRPSNVNHNKSSFVGGVSDGERGLSVMNIDRGDLKANKYWIMEDGFILCIGDSISTNRDDCELVTTIDQRAFSKDFKCSINGNQESMKHGLLKNTKQVFYNNMGYISLDMNSIIVDKNIHKGSWGDFMPIYPKNDISKEMLTLYINHGVSPKDASYSYLILPDKSDKETSSFDKNRIKISKKRGSILISIDNTRFYLIAYSPAEIKLREDINLSVSQSGLYMVKRLPNGRIALSVSDPLQRDCSYSGKINDKEFNVNMSDKHLGEPHNIDL